MIVLRCTKQMFKLLNQSPSAEREETIGDNILGEWYAKPVATWAGDLIIFVNARTLLTVGVPTSQTNQWHPLFVARVYNLLRMLNIPEAGIASEIAAYNKIYLAKTVNRSVLGSMTEIGYMCQFRAEDGQGQEISLSDLELDLSKALHGPLNYTYPRDVAAALFEQALSKQ